MSGIEAEQGEDLDQLFYSRNDTLELNLFAVRNLIADGALLEQLFQVIETASGPFVPDRISFGGKKMDFSALGAKKLVMEKKEKGLVSISLSCMQRPQAEYTVLFSDNDPDVATHFWMAVPMAEIEDHPEYVEAIKKLATELSDICHPEYGFAHSRADLTIGADPHIRDIDAENRVYEAHWLNIYGPAMIKEIGESIVSSIPDADMNRLDHGGILWTVGDTPADFSVQIERQKQATALSHLVAALSYDEALARLAARSETMAEVERDWDPDVAALLELTLDRVLLAGRPAEIERLNKFRPPAVSEWRPLEELLPANVEDEQEAISDYGELYAEQLVALLHSEMPEVMEGGHESLPLIDYHLWQLSYPTRFPREDIDEALIPAVGAYLGDVIINSLGGYWVPRENLDEAQLVLGDRVWLPFLRARHLLETRESILNHSMIQFYNTVARINRQAL